jgi:hypothetical protein
LFENEKKRKKVLDAAEGFALMNSPERIADIFIGFFTEILRRR